MKTIGGVPKIDALFIGEVRIDLLAFPDVNLAATIGYVDSKSGRRLGSVQRMTAWSPATMLALNALIDSMEQDVANDLFVGGTAGSGLEAPAPTSDGVPGL
jgi:hypothetical protein